MAEIPENEQNLVPQHVAIIMDGNGRWAEQRGKHRVFGHKAGVKAVRESVQYARKSGVKSLTLFAFSSENWRRPEDEVSALMELFITVLGSEVKKLHKNDIKLKVVGDKSAFSDRLQKKIADAERLTENNQSLVLNIAANYGGRWDIVQSARQLAGACRRGELHEDDISEEMFDSHTSFCGLPELDLLIRTGGDHRISNFLLWQVAYAELYFSDLLWPDFDEASFAQAVASFSCRERRYGQTGQQLQEQQ